VPLLPPPDPDALRAEVARIRWWHTIALGHGVITPGQDNSPQRLPRLGLPPELHGMTVLDIGAWDGFFSFECERRGAARVLATDHFCWNGAGWGTKAGFDLARRALGSRVEDLEIDVMDLSPERVGQFDLVLMLGVLYHLKHPLLALERVAGVTAGRLILDTEVDLASLRRPAAAFYPGAELDGDPTNWWGPNPAAVEGMLRSAGFARIEAVTPLPSLPARLRQAARLRLRDGRPFWSSLQRGRMVFHAWRI